MVQLPCLRAYVDPTNENDVSPLGIAYDDAGSNLTITAVILSRPPASFACATSVLQAEAGSDSARRIIAIASLVTISVNPSEHSSRRSPACTSSACAST